MKEESDTIEKYPEVETFGKDKPNPELLHSDVKEREKKETIISRNK